MFFRRLDSLSLILCLASCLNSEAMFAAEFEPGVGVGLGATDNARLTSTDTSDDVIATTYVGARISDNRSTLRYSADARFNKHNYLQDSFPDQRYFRLNASADWEVVKDHFNLFFRDNFGQRTIVALNSNTPDNIQDSNVVTVGADLMRPSAGRHSFSLTPKFDQYYYERLLTDNRQYSLSANWNYQLSRVFQTGINLNTRQVDYFEPQLADIQFNTASLVLSGQSKTTGYSLSLGSTSVERDNGGQTSGFSGFARFNTELTSRSTLRTTLSTSLTDTSTVATAPDLPPGSGDDVQIVADVLRNSIAGITYTREDASVRSNIWARYSKSTYSDNPLDRDNRALGVRASYPVQPLLTVGGYVTYNHSKQLDSGREDERYIVGSDVEYSFSRKLRGTLDVAYREKQSNLETQNYNEFSVFASLVYGFGNVARSTRAGGG